jgi:uncharacterized YigZ family protein
LENPIEFKTVEGFYESKIEEKRSKFISYLKNVSSEIEALDFIKTIKQKHKLAKHNVYAYSIHKNIIKFSDDGEPSGTAGIQVLNSIRFAKLQNIVIVVSRYFGGVLLGTGNLSRAYKHVSELVIENCKIIEKKMCKILEFQIKYDKFYKIINFLKSNCSLLEINYLHEVLLKIAVPLKFLEEFKINANRFCSEKIEFKICGEDYF